MYCGRSNHHWSLQHLSNSHRWSNNNDKEGETLCADPQTTCKLTLAGNPNYLSRHPQQCHTTDNKYAARCCGKDGERISMNRYGCHPKKTFEEAKKICESNEWRLCTVKEIKAGKTSGTGCGFDAHRVWTSTSGDDKGGDFKWDGYHMIRTQVKGYMTSQNILKACKAKGLKPVCDYAN